MPMKKYLIQFEKLYTKIKNHNMTLPDGALACRGLNSASLGEEEMKLCRATISELKYDTMVKQLIRIYGNSVSPSFQQSKEVVPKQCFMVVYSKQIRVIDYQGIETPREGGPNTGGVPCILTATRRPGEQAT